MPLAAVDFEACDVLCFAYAAVQQAIIHIQLCQKPFLYMEKQQSVTQSQIPELFHVVYIFHLCWFYEYVFMHPTTTVVEWETENVTPSGKIQKKATRT